MIQCRKAAFADLSMGHKPSIIVIKENKTQKTEVHIMFLFWLLLALAIGTMENITDSYKAYKYNSTGGFYARHPAFKPEPWEQEWIDKNRK